MVALSILELVRVSQDTDAQARRLFTVRRMSVAEMFRGTRSSSQPPMS